MKMKRELILERQKMKLHARKWKNVLHASDDAIVICSTNSVLFYNNSMTKFLENAKIYDKKIEDGLDIIFKESEIKGENGTLITWQGIN